MGAIFPRSFHAAHKTNNLVGIKANCQQSGNDTDVNVSMDLFVTNDLLFI